MDKFGVLNLIFLENFTLFNSKITDTYFQFYKK